MFQFHGTDRPADFRTVEGLNAAMATSLHRPDTLSDSAYANLSSPERAAYNRSRILYASGGITIGTHAYFATVKELTKAFAENVGRTSGHSGVLIDGGSTLGKTTILKAVMRDVYTDYGCQYPAFATDGLVPVVYIEVPARCTARALMVAFADFFGMTVLRSEHEIDIRPRVVEKLKEHKVQLVVVDELHNLLGHNQNNRDAADMLKSLHNQVASTFIYAGIRVADLLSGGGGEQIGARFTPVPIRRYNLSNLDDARAWKTFIKLYEAQLPLRHHQTGTLLAEHKYLYERTSGSIGSLTRLLTRATVAAIQDDQNPEAITRELLHAEKVDLVAELLQQARTTKGKGKNSHNELLKAVAA